MFGWEDFRLLIKIWTLSSQVLYMGNTCHTGKLSTVEYYSNCKTWSIVVVLVMDSHVLKIPSMIGVAFSKCLIKAGVYYQNTGCYPVSIEVAIYLRKYCVSSQIKFLSRLQKIVQNTCKTMKTWSSVFLHQILQVLLWPCRSYMLLCSLALSLIRNSTSSGDTTSPIAKLEVAW